MTTKTKTDATLKAKLVKLISLTQVEKVTSEDVKLISDAKMARMSATVDAAIATWNYAEAEFVSMLDAPTRKTIDGSALVKLMTEAEDSPVYIANEDDRKTVPSASHMSRAYWLAKLDTPTHRDAWVNGAGNTPMMQDYLSALKLNAGKGFQNAKQRETVAARFNVKRGKLPTVKAPTEAEKAEKARNAALAEKARKQDIADLKAFRAGEKVTPPTALDFLKPVMSADRDALQSIADSAGDFSWLPDAMVAPLVTALVARLMLESAPAPVAPGATLADQLKAQMAGVTS